MLVKSNMIVVIIIFESISFKAHQIYNGFFFLTTTNLLLTMLYCDFDTWLGLILKEINRQIWWCQYDKYATFVGLYLHFITNSNHKTQFTHHLVHATQPLNAKNHNGTMKLIFGASSTFVLYRMCALVQNSLKWVSKDITNPSFVCSYIFKYVCCLRWTLGKHLKTCKMSSDCTLVVGHFTIP